MQNNEINPEKAEICGFSLEKVCVSPAPGGAAVREQLCSTLLLINKYSANVKVQICYSLQSPSLFSSWRPPEERMVLANGPVASENIFNSLHSSDAQGGRELLQQVLWSCCLTCPVAESFLFSISKSHTLDYSRVCGGLCSMEQCDSGVGLETREWLREFVNRG